MKAKRLTRISFAILLTAAITFSLTGMAQAQTLQVLYSFTGHYDGGNLSGGVIFDSAGNLYGTTVLDGNPNDCTNFPGCGVVFKLSPTASGPWQDTTLFRFKNAATGASPTGNLLMDSNGNLIGVTTAGGTSSNCSGATTGCGLAFELSPAAAGLWSETVLQSFNTFVDGEFSDGGLIADSAGNLYGTTFVGGDASGCGGIGCGTVFRLSPSASGWEETVLYAFTGAADGGGPFASLTFDSEGNLYGTTTQGGTLTDCASWGCGVVFKLSPTASGPWTETTLHSYSGSTDGSDPKAGLSFDSAGNLYGTTYQGGLAGNCTDYTGCGTVFKLAPLAGGQWHFSLVHRFTGGADGANSSAGLTIDASGNLYGTAQNGGSLVNCGTGCGVVFKMSPNGTGWHETVLHTFKGNEGYGPEGPLTFDASGNLYGTTWGGGNLGQGTVFKIQF
jgi:uncharacterized repeat protein (TIGR03803 family)